MVYKFIILGFFGHSIILSILSYFCFGGLKNGGWFFLYTIGFLLSALIASKPIKNVKNQVRMNLGGEYSGVAAQDIFKLNKKSNQSDVNLANKFVYWSNFAGVIVGSYYCWAVAVFLYVVA